MKLIHIFTVSTKKEKRTKKERNGCGYSFNSFCPTKRTHPTLNQTNPYLKDPVERKKWVILSVSTSTAIEGVHLSQSDFSQKSSRALSSPKSSHRSTHH